MAGPVDLYAVMGNPVAHSKSPLIHTMFADQTQQRLQYAARLVPVDGFEKAVEFFYKEQNGGHGLSITAPFKEQAWEIAQQRTSRAQRAGAINTLWLSNDGVLHGDNTDGLGLVQDLMVNHQVSLENARILILGAGGAVRGVLELILEQKPAELIIANRTASKAEHLVTLFSGKLVKACGFTELTGTFDLIINGTSASLQGDLPPLPDSIVTNQTCCYDMMYAKETTVFNQWGLAHGADKALDGLGMLVEQAAEQFALWRGVRPETADILKLLRNQMAG